MSTILVLKASTRPTDTGHLIASWVTEALGHSNVTNVDLADLALPLLNEPVAAKNRDYLHTHTKLWSEIVDAADGLVFVFPEYNSGPPGSLKDALDYLYWEWQDKAVALVTYSGGPSGGASAREIVRTVVESIGMVPLEHSVGIPQAHEYANSGQFEPDEEVQLQMAQVTKELHSHLNGEDHLIVA